MTSCGKLTPSSQPARAGQFTQLGSPRQVVVENAWRDLEYHNEMMDRMGLGKDSVMIIHVRRRFTPPRSTVWSSS